MGRLIPAGTGLGAYKRLSVDVDGLEAGSENAEVGRPAGGAVPSPSAEAPVTEDSAPSAL